MNDAQSDDDLMLTWGLEQATGEDASPDFVRVVRQRVHARASAHSRWRRRSQVAAGILLGISVVVGVALRSKQPPPDEAAPATTVPPQEPTPVVVLGLADLTALPKDTRAIEAVGVDDRVMEALTRFQELEVLVVREPWNEVFGFELKLTAPPTPRRVTAASWRHLVTFKKLRRLELSGTAALGRIAADVGSIGDGLEAMPLLESLSMRFFDTPDDVVGLIGKVRNLRHLDLSFNHGFEEAGIDEIAKHGSLRSLSLQGCQQLRGSLLARLATLPEIEVLDLSRIDGVSWRGVPGVLDDEDLRVISRARRLGDAIGMGPTEMTLQALAETARLRVLDVSGSRYLTAVGLESLLSNPSLRVLKIRTPSISIGCMEALTAATQLDELYLDLPLEDFVMSQQVARLRRELPNLRHFEITDAAKLRVRAR